MFDSTRLVDAYQTARRDLLACRVGQGHWVGELSTSALSTATAVSALAMVQRHCREGSIHEACRQLVAGGLQRLAECQNSDGGWGDTDKSFSNIATTMLVQAAFRIAGRADDHLQQLGRAEAYVSGEGGVAGLRERFGEDKTFAVPILTNLALAGIAPWQDIDPLPFELACLPYPLLRFLRLPVVSYAVPALVAVGQAVYFNRKPLNPITRLLRCLCVGPSLRVLQRMQPASGGFLEAVPLTSFVVMSLAGTGRVEHAVVRAGVKFLIESVRPDGSWPIDTNLATWNTTLAVNALAAASGDVGALGCLDWLLNCQHQKLHPCTHAEPGGWGWSDSSGAVPDVDDTSGALLALATLLESSPQADAGRIESAAAAGVEWLLQLQNDDGGWPTFCRGWGALPFDRSGADLTAHAIRALHRWRTLAAEGRIEAAIQRGLDYLAGKQRPDGSWIPLWFGNQHNVDEQNPVYGTARVLLAYRDLGLSGCEAARAALNHLADSRCADGGWGGGTAGGAAGVSSIEETAMATEALLADETDGRLQTIAAEGVQKLIEAVESGRHCQTAPIGLYFAKLWYYESTYPRAFTVSALGQAVRRFDSGGKSDHNR